MIRGKQIGLALVVLLVLWQLLAMLVQMPILPSPYLVLTVLVKEVFQGKLAGHFFASFWRVFASTFLAILLAAPAGLILGQSKTIGKMAAPFIYLLYPIPKVVLLPVILLFLGIGDLSKIFIIFHDFVFSNRGLGARSGSHHPPGINSKCAQFGGGPAGFVPLCLFTSQYSGHSDRLTPIHRHSRSGFICSGIIRHPKRTGLLYLPERINHV